ncbi:MAG: Protein of unknown function DUF664 [uncultured Thermomicrobiales bacterium]|uniref:Dienelactone hydrolase domain-containing protein n=1 Tax=uncultured Thermomicrobiales bacterium TaxID=1645740 RepID=A0A6J4UX10_9BACT|nr:MAG: Protein of unknown function DUF664 [uncultured Thermomicrobiales bacterium]
MTEIVLFHHAQGLTAGMLAFGDRLRRAGHVVHTPDLFDGRTFDTVEEGVSHARDIGFGEVLERGIRAVEGLPAELVYAGFSLGVMPAQRLAQTRAGARGALLFHACLPVSEFGDAWPTGVPVQIHGMAADPFFADEGDLDAARALVAETNDAELFLYPGEQHLFADSSLPSYDPDAATLLTERVLAFLDDVRERDEDGRPGPPAAGDEIATLLGFLDYQRATLDWKTRGLDEAGLQATVGVSSITLGGLLKHLAFVEDMWFSRRLRGRDAGPSWVTGEWDTDSHLSWNPTADETYEDLHALWREAVSHSRAMVSEALAEGGMDVLARTSRQNGRSPTLREVLVHMIEEYARHNGHADLIRESVDGQTGE